jgi:hypothetical protein
MISSFVGWVTSFKEVEFGHYWVAVSVDCEIDQNGECHQRQNRLRCFVHWDEDICWENTQAIAGYLDEQGNVTKVEILI